MSDARTIPSQWTVDGFMTRYDEHCKTSRTYMEAYTATEEEHKNTFGQYRYKNYEAFRSSRKNTLLKK